MPRQLAIKLKDLLVNIENYRYEPLSGQREAIDRMVEDQGDYLLHLAEDLLNFGLNPNDRLQVVASPHDPGKYIVLEGNRRTVAMKLVYNPELLDGNPLRKRFMKLDKKKLPKTVDCLVYTDPTEADHWIALKHGYGKGGVVTDGWNPLQKQRYAERIDGKTSTALQVIKALKESADVKEDLKIRLDTISSTNLDRLLGDSYVRSKLGIELNNGVIQSSVQRTEVVRGLATIAESIMSPGFKVARIYDRVNRKDYIDGVPAKKLPNLSLKEAAAWQLTSGASARASNTRVRSPHRTRLIPRSCKLNISNAKVNEIYHELMTIDIKQKHAISVLLRVFVELSVDSYIEKHKLVKSPSAAKSGMDFQQKANMVANHLETKTHVDAAICKGIRAAMKEKHDVLGVDTLHSYVHNNQFSPKSDNLITTWNNIEAFITILWENA